VERGLNACRKKDGNARYVLILCEPSAPPMSVITDCECRVQTFDYYAERGILN